MHHFYLIMISLSVDYTGSTDYITKNRAGCNQPALFIKFLSEQNLIYQFRITYSNSIL